MALWYEDSRSGGGSGKEMPLAVWRNPAWWGDSVSMQQPTERIARMLPASGASIQRPTENYTEREGFVQIQAVAFMYIHEDRLEKGKTAPRATQVIHLGFALIPTRACTWCTTRRRTNF